MIMPLGKILSFEERSIRTKCTQNIQSCHREIFSWYSEFNTIVILRKLLLFNKLQEIFIEVCDVAWRLGNFYPPGHAQSFSAIIVKNDQICLNFQRMLILLLCIEHSDFLGKFLPPRAYPQPTSNPSIKPSNHSLN